MTYSSPSIGAGHRTRIDVEIKRRRLAEVLEPVILHIAMLSAQIGQLKPTLKLANGLQCCVERYTWSIATHGTLQQRHEALLAAHLQTALPPWETMHLSQSCSVKVRRSSTHGIALRVSVVVLLSLCLTERLAADDAEKSN